MSFTVSKHGDPKHETKAIIVKSETTELIALNVIFKNVETNVGKQNRPGTTDDDGNPVYCRLVVK